MNTDGLRRMNAGFWLRAGAGLAGLALLVAYSSGGCSPRVGPGKAPCEPGFPLPAGAGILEVKSEPVSPVVEVLGTVVPEAKIDLSSRISAYVRETFVSAGSRVTKGQVLITLDDRELKEQEAVMEAQLTQARTEYERTRQLREKNAATDQALTAAETAMNSALAQAQRARVMRSYAQVVSSLDGIVTDRQIEVNDLASPGQVLVTVYDPALMRFDAPVPVRFIDRIHLGQKVSVRLDRLASPVSGTVGQIVAEVDTLTRTQTVKIQLEGTPESVLPGTFGRLLIEDAPRPAIRVPSACVIRVGQLEMVQKVENGRVIRQLVRTVPSGGDFVEILSGLSGGDRIVAQPVPEA